MKFIAGFLAAIFVIASIPLYSGIAQEFGLMDYHIEYDIFEIRSRYEPDDAVTYHPLDNIESIIGSWLR